MDEVSSNTSRRPVISFEEAMQNAMLRKSNVNQAHTPSKYRVEVYLKIPFVAETENRSSFTPKAFDVTAAHRHNNGNQEAYQHPHLPFEGRTTAQDTYVAHPIQKAQQSPSMTVPTYQPVKTTFHGRSHYQVAGVPLMSLPCMMLVRIVLTSPIPLHRRLSLPRRLTTPNYRNKRATLSPRLTFLSRASTAIAPTTRNTRSAFRRNPASAFARIRAAPSACRPTPRNSNELTSTLASARCRARPNKRAQNA